MVAAPCLAVLAGCIGNRRRIILKPGAWTEPAILWIVLVLLSGGKKSPALKAVLKPLKKRELAELDAEKERHAEYNREMEAWKRLPDETRGEPPEKPEPAHRLLVSDITTEGLLLVHSRAPLGLLLARDELAGWVRSFNQYKAGGRGGDAQTWAEMHQAGAAFVDRKGSETLSVPRAAVSILGGIQPELLREALSGEHLFDGIAARILFVTPEEDIKTWTDDTISAEAREGWASLLRELRALEPDPGGDPIDLPMTAEAKAEWVKFYEEHAQREYQAKGPYRSALSKLEAATARFALVIQLADDPKSKAVGVKAMRAAIEISEWFEAQARRVYLGAKAEQLKQDRQEAYDWIAGRKGSITQRDFARFGPYKFRKRAEEVLEDLVAAGLASRIEVVGKKGHRYKVCDPDPTQGASS
jgi:hypothetical protein